MTAAGAWLANRLGRVREPGDRRRLICREKSCRQDMRDDIPVALRSSSLGKATATHSAPTGPAAARTERYHGPPCARSTVVRNRLGELAPAFTDRRIDGADQALHAWLVT